MDLKETVCEGVEWIRLAQDRDHCRDLVKMGSCKARNFYISIISCPPGYLLKKKPGVSEGASLLVLLITRLHG
jgi:hypothetical protein